MKGTPVDFEGQFCIIERWLKKPTSDIGTMIEVDGCDATLVGPFTVFSVLAPGYPRSRGLWVCLTVSNSASRNSAGLTTIEAECLWEPTK